MENEPYMTLIIEKNNKGIRCLKSKIHENGEVLVKTNFKHYHCPFCEKPYPTKQEAFECCLKEGETIEMQIFKRLRTHVNLPTVALQLKGLNDNAFKGKRKLYKALKQMDKFEFKLWNLTKGE